MIAPVNVLAVLDRAVMPLPGTRGDLREARAAVARLIETSAAALQYMRLHQYADQAWADDLAAALAAVGAQQPEAQACVAHATAAKDAEIEALRAEVAEARPSEAGYRAGVFPGGIANPADVDGADSGDWYCERHPESLQGHDGCEGAGMPSSARIPMLVHQVRMLMQELRERDLQYGFLARAALHPTAAQENDDA